MKTEKNKTGPGRPRLKNKKVSVTVRINPLLLEFIQGNRSLFIETAIFEKIMR